MSLRLVALFLMATMCVLAGCRESGEFFSFTGKPEGADGWLEDYEANPKDVWEAFRLVMKDNGRITKEDPERMTIEGINLAHDSSETDGYNVKGTVYDKSRDGRMVGRLIVHAWYANNANERERQDVAYSYTNAVYRVLRQWKGNKEEDPNKNRVETTSDAPVEADEAVGYYRVSRDQALAACEAVVKAYGTVEEVRKEQGFLRGLKKNALEKSADDVRISAYDRTEGDKVRVKISIRVRGPKNEALQEVAQGYLAEIRKELEKRHGLAASTGEKTP